MSRYPPPPRRTRALIPSDPNIGDKWRDYSIIVTTIYRKNTSTVKTGIKRLDNTLDVIQSMRCLASVYPANLAAPGTQGELYSVLHTVKPILLEERGWKATKMGVGREQEEGRPR